MNRFLLALFFLIPTIPLQAWSQITLAPIDMAERLCKTHGSSTDIKVKFEGSAQTGKIIAQFIGLNGKIAGIGEFSKNEWDGVKFVNSPETYVKCLELVLVKMRVEGSVATYNGEHGVVTTSGATENVSCVAYAGPNGAGTTCKDKDGNVRSRDTKGRP